MPCRATRHTSASPAQGRCQSPPPPTVPHSRCRHGEIRRTSWHTARLVFPFQLRVLEFHGWASQGWTDASREATWVFVPKPWKALLCRPALKKVRPLHVDQFGKRRHADRSESPQSRQRFRPSPGRHWHACRGPHRWVCAARCGAGVQAIHLHHQDSFESPWRRANLAGWRHSLGQQHRKFGCTCTRMLDLRQGRWAKHGQKPAL